MTAFGHAVFADQGGERAGIDAGNGDDAAGLEPLIEMSGGPVVGTARVMPSARMQPRTPDAAARLAVSISSSLAPTLPICGNVKVMICPA